MSRSSTLQMKSVAIPTAALGEPSDLVPVRHRHDVHTLDDSADVDEDLRSGIGYGHAATLAPYLPQDRYDRHLIPREHRIAVLENDQLRAEVMLDHGGRLRSLFDKTRGRELLYVNSVFQPANLALRNAWTSGGVEWNIGTIGHGPFTASPLHAVRVERSDGAAVLRLYEYERLRGVVFSIEYVLSPESRQLVVRNTIHNPAAETVTTPIYWWSNIAVAQSPGSRVLVPADAAWKFTYEGRVRRSPIVTTDFRADYTYPDRARDAADYFFDLGSAGYPWIAAVDSDGLGLLQVSDSRLQGRKLFVWGTEAGGERWQSWLSHGTGHYFEIQAGLARTQLEHIPMPGATTWTWVEAYGPVEAPAGPAHSSNWQEARNAVEASEDLAAMRQRIDDETHRDRRSDAIGQTMGSGSGWGALEAIRRRYAHEQAIDDSETPFAPEQLGPEQDYWIALLEGREPQAEKAPSYQIDPFWLPLLKKSGSATALLHSAVVQASAGRTHEAAAEALHAAEIGEDWQAQRAAGLLLIDLGAEEEGTSHLLRAVELNSDPRLLAEVCTLLLSIGRFAAVLEVIPPDTSAGSLLMIKARALLAVGRARDARHLLDAGFEVPDLVEGDESMASLWREISIQLIFEATPTISVDAAQLQAERHDPLPPRYDFRMKRPVSDTHV